MAFSLDQPVADFVTTELVIDRLLVFLGSDHARSWLQHVVTPTRKRWQSFFAGRLNAVSESLPETSLSWLLQRAAKPVHLPEKVREEIATSAFLREQIKALLTESLARFGAQMPGASVRSALTKGARALLGGVSDDWSHKFNERVDEFIESSVERLQRGLAERLATGASEAAMGRERQKWLKYALNLAEKQWAEAADEATLLELEALAIVVIAHNLSRPAVRAFVESELAWLRQQLGTTTARELLSWWDAQKKS